MIRWLRSSSISDRFSGGSTARELCSEPNCVCDSDIEQREKLRMYHRCIMTTITS